MVRTQQTSAIFRKQKTKKKKKFLKPISILSKQDHMKQTLGNLEIYVDDMMKYLIT